GWRERRARGAARPACRPARTRPGARSSPAPRGLLLGRRLRPGAPRRGPRAAAGSRELRPNVVGEALDVGEDRPQLLHGVIEDEVRDAELLVAADIGHDLVRGALERRPGARGGPGVSAAHLHWGADGEHDRLRIASDAPRPVVDLLRPPGALVAAHD